MDDLISAQNYAGRIELAMNMSDRFSSFNDVMRVKLRISLEKTELARHEPFVEAGLAAPQSSL